MRNLLLIAVALIVSAGHIFSQDNKAEKALLETGYTYIDFKMDTYDRFVVNAELDGKKVKLIVSHNFTETILDKNTLDRLGIQVDETGKEWNVNGDSDDMYVTTIKETRIGEGVIAEQDVMVVDFEEFDYLENTRADGFLGSDFLMKYKALIDLTNQRIYIDTQ